MAAEKTTFFTRSGNFCCVVKHQERHIDQDTKQVVTIPSKRAEFSQLSNGWGTFTTEDPEIITALRKRADVFEGQKYLDQITTAEVKNAQLQGENQRMIEENNRLMALLNDQKKKSA